jgi:hypothetical protein
MKWVLIGMLVSLVFVAIAVYIDKDRWPSIFGGALAAVIMWCAYDYANKNGLMESGPGTEQNALR